MVYSQGGRRNPGLEVRVETLLVDSSRKPPSQVRVSENEATGNISCSHVSLRPL